MMGYKTPNIDSIIKDGRITDTGPLTRKRMGPIDEEAVLPR